MKTVHSTLITTDLALPTRVLMLSEGRAPHLHICKSTEKGRYIALSHRWGSYKPLVTTLSNLDDHMAGISWGETSKTFQYAIIICQRLGVDFIWIDSLCIIQDSTADWETEAAQMSSIYSNAWVTTAADGASDPHEGFLVGNRQKDRNKVCIFSAPGKSGGEVQIFVREERGPRTLPFPHHVVDRFTVSSLEDRGWIFQESFLSPRILHFPADEMTWECLTMAQCECQLGSSNPQSFTISRIGKEKCPWTF